MSIKGTGRSVASKSGRIVRSNVDNAKRVAASALSQRRSLSERHQRGWRQRREEFSAIQKRPKGQSRQLEVFCLRAAANERALRKPQRRAKRW